MTKGDKVKWSEFLRGQIRDYIFSAYQDERGVHAESVLVALGALAGFAVQEGLRQALVVQGGKPENTVFTIIETQNREKYFFGELFDQFLLGVKEGHISVWSLIGGAAQNAGATVLPDMRELAKRNAERLGSSSYGEGPIVEGHPFKEKPITVLRHHWPRINTYLRVTKTNPLSWGWEIAFAAQKVIIESKHIIPPSVSALLVMDPAISMSKIDPSRLK